MAQEWGGAGNATAFEVNFNADRTTGIITNPVPNPAGTTIGLDALATSSRTTGAINAAVYHVANTVALHLNTGDGTVAATAANMLLMPGERLMILPAEYVAVIRAAGSSDGIVRFTECV